MVEAGAAAVEEAVAAEAEAAVAAAVMMETAAMAEAEAEEAVAPIVSAILTGAAFPMKVAMMVGATVVEVLVQRNLLKNRQNHHQPLRPTRIRRQHQQR